MKVSLTEAFGMRTQSGRIEVSGTPLLEIIDCRIQTGHTALKTATRSCRE